jgi:hypothetical protein
MRSHSRRQRASREKRKRVLHTYNEHRRTRTTYTKARDTNTKFYVVV